MKAVMTRKPGNSNWGKPDTGRQPPPCQTSFEEAVTALKLSSPREYASSAALKEWVRKNKDHKYVPLELLSIWGFDAKVNCKVTLAPP
jgi:hypothetical protein